MWRESYYLTQSKNDKEACKIRNNEKSQRLFQETVFKSIKPAEPLKNDDRGKPNNSEGGANRARGGFSNEQ